MFKSNTVKYSAIAVGVILLSYLALNLIMRTYVKPNQVGVWMKNGGMNGESDYQVWTGYFPVDFSPLTRSFVIPGQSYSIDLEKSVVLSKENGEWTVDPQFTFSIDKEQAVRICHRYNSFLVDGDDDKFLGSVGQYVLTPIIRNSFTEIIGSLKDTIMMDDKVRVQKMLEDSVRIGFKRVGFVLDNFVTGVTPPSSILKTNQAKNEALQAVYAAKAEVEKANAQAAVKLATAKADAEAMLITARADSEARRLKQATLSPLVIQSMLIDKWDGALPHTSLGSNTSIMLPSISNK